MDEIQEDRSNLTLSDYLFHAKANLSGFQVILREQKAGAAIAFRLREIVSNDTAAADSALSTLRTELLLQAIPRLLGTTQTNPPTPDDNPATYLHRVTVTARTNSDWALLGRVLNLTVDLRIELVSLGADQAATHLLLGGLNLERAHQYAAAVYSYEAALKTGSQLLPAEFVGERLENLRKDHPKEFAEGQTASSNVPLRRFSGLEARTTLCSEYGAISVGGPDGEITVPAVSATPVGK